MSKEKVYKDLKELKWGKISNVNVSSWAIWREIDVDDSEINVTALKDGIRDVSMFDDELRCYTMINTDYVFVGLNASEGNDEYVESDKPWHSFHSSKPLGNDYKLRYALMNGKFRGSYITDVFKCYRKTDSSTVVKYYADPQNVKKMHVQFKMLKNELDAIGATKLVAMGSAAYRFLRIFNAKYDYQYDIRRVYHYACNKGFKDYRDHMLERLNGF